MRFTYKGETLRLVFRRSRQFRQWKWSEWLAEQKGFHATGIGVMYSKDEIRAMAEVLGPVAKAPTYETMISSVYVVDSKGNATATATTTCSPLDFPATVEKGRRAAVEKLCKQCKDPELANLIRAAYYNRRNAKVITHV
jgi:hypothetical protein